ncbi:MAG: hypothetical protein M5U26_02855 [Planctomycetota bacterium]|nr:hypothetical protein [Planctomycetota bacterium]
MFGWFDRLPDDDCIDWTFATWRWLLENFGGWREFHKRRLILPKREYYPNVEGKSEEIARRYFDLTREYAGLAGWPCRLEPQRDWDPEIGRGRPPYAWETHGAAGTFSSDWNSSEVVITYSETLVDQPQAMIACFAHELSHYLNRSAPLPPPAGEIAEEHATDLCAVFIGFGIFMANGAFHFEQYTDAQGHGWRASRRGYLNELQLSYALALFCALKDIPIDAARAHLKTNPKSYVKSAARHLARDRAEDVALLKNVKAARMWP